MTAVVEEIFERHDKVDHYGVEGLRAVIEKHQPRCGSCAHWNRLGEKSVGTCPELCKKMMGSFMVANPEQEQAMTWWTLDDFGCVLFKKAV
jgi:hypothetical protein